MTSVAPRIVNDFSYVTQINHESRAIYLVMLHGDSFCSAHCK